jgi:uncharacterized membrane protein YphA (DoxX/SURF4 family)
MSDYPRGRQAIALLALRLMVGATLLFQGASCLSLWNSVAQLSFSIAALLGGTLLIAGFLTPVVAVLIALPSIAAVFLQTTLCKSTLFDTKLSAIFAAGVLLALSLLGPGALSIDARVFGRRRIIIPPRPPV